MLSFLSLPLLLSLHWDLLGSCIAGLLIYWSLGLLGSWAPGSSSAELLLSHHSSSHSAGETDPPPSLSLSLSLSFALLGALSPLSATEKSQLTYPPPPPPKQQQNPTPVYFGVTFAPLLLIDYIFPIPLLHEKERTSYRTRALFSSLTNLVRDIDDNWRLRSFIENIHMGSISGRLHRSKPKPKEISSFEPRLPSCV